MPGIPDTVAGGPWWWVYVYLLCIVFARAQGTYWLGRWLRRGATGVEGSHADAVADTVSVSEESAATGFRARMHRRFSGPSWQRAQAFLDRWGFVGIPLSFLTIGFQTMVNGAAGFLRMRWDLYTLAMLPGCLMWAAVWTGVAVGLSEAWKRSPWVFAAALGIVALAGVLTVVRRRARPTTDEV